MGMTSRCHNQFGGFCLFQGFHRRTVYLNEGTVQKGWQDERKEKEMVSILQEKREHFTCPVLE